MKISKDQALKALIDSSSLTEAAEKAGISRRTLYNYIHNDLEFANAYKEMHDQDTINFYESLTMRREKAFKTVSEILEDSEQPVKERLKAAEIIISSTANQRPVISGIASDNILSLKGALSIF